MKVEITHDYKKFRFIKGNRPVVKNKIKKLVDSYKSGLNLFPFCPILVNKDHYVIDGQHRLTACKELSIPIHFTIVPNFDLKQIARINEASNKWSMKDFFNCYIETGKQDYKALFFFKDKHSLNTSLAAQLLMNGTPEDGGGKIGDIFRNGEFKVVKLKEAEALMSKVNEYEDVCEDSIRTSRTFIRAVYLLLKSESYNHSEIIAKLKKNNSEIQKRGGYKDYIYHIEELFNKNNSRRYIIYK